MVNKLKRASILGGLVTGSIAMAACGGGGNGDASGPGNGSSGSGYESVTIAAEPWMIEKLGFPAMAEAFTEDTGIEVNVVEYADPEALSSFSLQWKTGSADQDLVVVDGASTGVQFLEQDLIVDFNETGVFSGPLTKEDFVGEALAFNEKDGVQFSLPIGLETYNISANKSFFEDADLLTSDGEMPTFEDWEAVYDAAKAIYEDTGNPGMTIQWGPNAFSTMLSVEQAGRGDFYGPDGMTATFDTEEKREVFSIWKRGVDEGVFSTDTFSNKDAGRSNYNARGLAMLLETAAHVPEAAADIGEENAVLMQMPGSDQNGSYGFSAGIVMPKASENQEVAVQFLQEAVMTDLQVEPGLEWGKLPVIKSAFDEIDADWKDGMYETVQLSVPAPMYPDLVKIQDRSKQMLQEYLTGSENDPDDFIGKLENLFDESNLGIE